MYTFKNTEINNKKASEFETKSMLFLLGICADNEEIETVVVDCFNDVTGSNKSFSKLWDVQSKNHRKLTPAVIGDSLYTLYKNFVSGFNFFHDYILFIPKLKREYLIDPEVSIYGYSNIQSNKKKWIEKKLIEKIDTISSSGKPLLFDEFLNKVNFVEDNNSIVEYIKIISKFQNKSSASDQIYENIFTEIRDKQSVLKNSYIENETVAHPSQIVKYNRHFRRTDIETLLISRLVGIDIFSFPGAPPSFYKVLKNELVGDDEEEVKDILLNCEANISRAFFDKNSCSSFWRVTEEIIISLKSDMKQDAYSCKDSLSSKAIDSLIYFDDIDLLYLISVIKLGLGKC